jgi:outer membrane protein TolC
MAPAQEDAEEPTEVPVPISQAVTDAKAPDVIALDLSKALDTALSHNRDYQSQREDLYLASLNVLAEKHLWGPRFFSSVSGLVSGTPEDGEHDQALSVITQFGVTQRLPYGGSISATALVDFVQLLKDTSGGSGEGQDAALVLSARLPLLRGAGQAARENLIQVYRDLIYATRDFERFRRQFLLTVSTQYFNLLQSQAQIANLERQVNNLEWLSSRIQAMANAGRQPFFEVQRAQQQVLFARNNLLNAQESYATSLDSFKIQLGLDTIQPIRIVPSEVMIPQPALEVTSATSLAWKLRLDLQTSSDQVADARRHVAVARNQLLPDLDVTADMRLNTDPTDRYAGLNLDPSHSTYSAGLVLDLPLDRRLEEIGVRRSLINLERSRRSYSLLRDRVAQQVRQSVREIDQARFTLQIQNHNITMAQKRLEGVVLRLATLEPRDFTDAESDLLEARNRRDGALRDLRVSILQYLLDTGQMRVASNGQWNPPAGLTPAPTPDQMLGHHSPGEYYDRPEQKPLPVPGQAPATQPGATNGPASMEPAGDGADGGAVDPNKSAAVHGPAAPPASSNVPALIPSAGLMPESTPAPSSSNTAAPPGQPTPVHQADDASAILNRPSAGEPATAPAATQPDDADVNTTQPESTGQKPVTATPAPTPTSSMEAVP